jgi:hypothetical protein
MKVSYGHTIDPLIRIIWLAHHHEGVTSEKYLEMCEWGVADAQWTAEFEHAAEHDEYYQTWCAEEGCTHN